MPDTKAVRDRIISSYRDVKRFSTDAYPPDFVGPARARYIRAIGDTELIWNCDKVKMRINAGSLGERRWREGEIEIVGDLTVTGLFGGEGQETYVYSKGGLLKEIADTYSHVVRRETETQTSRVTAVSEKEYWPTMLEHYLKHGNFDLQSRFGLQDILLGGVERRVGVQTDTIEKVHYEEMTDAAKLVKEVFDKTRGHKHLIPLSSIKPFSKAVLRRVEVHGNSMRVLYIPSGSRTPERERLSGSIYLLTNEAQTAPIPAVIRAGFGNSHAEFPIIDAEMIRTDGQPKRGRLDLEAKELELYTSKVGETEFVSYGRDVLNYLVKNPATYVSLGLTLGLPVIMRVARLGRIRPLVIALPLIGIAAGIYSFYNAFRNAEKRVDGDRFIYFWGRGKELT